MKILPITSVSDQRGMALLYALFGAFVAATLVSISLTMSTMSNGQAKMKVGQIQAQYRAEGAAEAAKKIVQEAIANWQPVPLGGTVALGEDFVEYTITALDLDPNTEVLDAELVDTDAGGIQTVVRAYEITTEAVVDGYQAHAHRIINSKATPIFQYAVFMEEDLVIQPGPDMTIKGRVHTNGDMWLSPRGTVTFDTNYLHAVGSIHRRRKDDEQSFGAVNVRQWVVDPTDASEPVSLVSMHSRETMLVDEGAETVSGYDSDFEGFDANLDGDFDDEGDWLPWGPGALELWGEPEGYTAGSGNTVMTGEHGLQEAVTPNIGSIQMFDYAAEGGDFVWDEDAQQYAAVAPGTGTHQRGFFHEEAGLSIIIDANGITWTATTGEGEDVTNELAGVVTLADVYDARQGGDIAVAQIDIAQLSASGYFPDNGLVYAGHYGDEVYTEELVDDDGNAVITTIPGSIGAGTDARGIQLVNGALVNGHYDENGVPVGNGTSGLTFVTQGPAYVTGDFNTELPRGCAVIADAVNLLSNAWDGTKVEGVLPAAEDTTFNLAMITGQEQSDVGGEYVGGLENLPRFHESWSGRTCHINGSFVNTWEPRFATSSWSYGGDVYYAPIRDWAYDTSFNTLDGLPPFTPMAVAAEEIVAW